MTCIAGLVDDGAVYIGADSAGRNGYDLTVRADRKVFVNNGFLIGFTSSFRMGQLLQYAFKPPKYHPDEKDLYEFMVTDFIDAVRACLKAGGYAQIDNGEESGGTFLVGYRGRLFRVAGDYQVGESVCAYAACGCGESFAMGSLFTSGGETPGERILIALHAAEEFSAGVKGPFYTKMLESEWEGLK